MSARKNAIEFWKEFEKVEHSIRDLLNRENYEECMELVEPLDSYAYESFGCHFFVDNAYGDYELTWDTGPNKTIQYLAAMVCQLAPQSIKKSWILNACLPPLSQKAIQAQVQIKDRIYTLTDFMLFYTEDETQQAWHCEVYCPGFSLITNPENKKEMSMYLLELALGQCAYEAYIGSVDFLDAPKMDESFCNLVDGYEKLMDHVETKGWKTYQSPLEIYSVFQPVQDFAHDSMRKDMKFIFTTHPLLIEETLEEKTDVLKDLEVKQGEFDYIYYNNLFNTREDALFRQELSKQFDQAFQKSECARVIGGAIGKSYSYIDCIVFDVHRFQSTLDQIKKQLDSKVKLHVQKF